MVIIIEENGKIIWKMVKEHIFLHLALDMKDHG